MKRISNELDSDRDASSVRSSIEEFGGAWLFILSYMKSRVADCDTLLLDGKKVLLSEQRNSFMM